jgi:hypothetical protein
MLAQVPLIIRILFISITIVSIVWVYRATGSKTFLLIVSIWAIIQSILGLSVIYQHTDLPVPLIMPLGIMPTIIAILACLTTSKGKKFLKLINLQTLTYFHSIRIVVEILLALLYQIGVMSIYITYHGTNFDLLSGLTAPIIAYFVFKQNLKHPKLLFWWNALALLLLLNVVITAIFAIPSPFQKLAFEQPNLAILYFPFNLLPTVIVPLVMFAHVVAFFQLQGTKNMVQNN